LTISGFDGSDISISALSRDGRALLAEVNEIIDGIFADPDADTIISMERDAYFEMVLAAQTRINDLNATTRLFHSERSVFDHAMKGAKGSAQVTPYLRAVRPLNGRPSEHVDFHQESFFNPDLRHAWNIWIPVRNVTPDNALKFIPKSQLIPNAEIGTVNAGEQTGLIKRYTAGHKVGLHYNPIRIVSGVDFSTVETLYVPPAHIALFNANLVHGAGVNQTGKIRFSLDFRIIPTEKIKYRGYSFATGGKYFAELG